MDYVLYYTVKRGTPNRKTDRFYSSGQKMCPQFKTSFHREDSLVHDAISSSTKKKSNIFLEKYSGWTVSMLREADKPHKETVSHVFERLRGMKASELLNCGRFEFGYGFLMHHGIKGQKWGVRNGPPYPLGNGKKKGVSKLQKYDILDPVSGERYHFSKGSRLLDTETFAGKGTKHPLNDEVVLGLCEQIGGKPENWQHCKAYADIDYFGEDREAEVHWFQEETVGKCKFRIKRWLDE